MKQNVKDILKRIVEKAVNYASVIKKAIALSKIRNAIALSGLQ